MPGSFDGFLENSEKSNKFALALRYGVMVALQILVLPVQVRVLISQLFEGGQVAALFLFRLPEGVETSRNQGI